MREINQNELAAVAGGYVEDLWSTTEVYWMTEIASEDGFSTGVLTGIVTAFVGLEMNADPATIMWSSVAMGSMGYIAGYHGSDIWPWYW